MCNIPALVLPSWWELHHHKLCSSLLHSLFLKGQREGLLVYTSMVTQSVTVLWQICAVGSSVAAVSRHFGGKVSGLSASTFCWAHSPLSWRLLPAVLEILAFLVSEKNQKIWNLTVFWSVTHDFLPWWAHTIAFFQLPFVSLHVAAPADVQGGVLVLMHPKSSFCVCKSQHPRAQVSLFPTGECRGSAWQGHMCTSSCPFGQTSL